MLNDGSGFKKVYLATGFTDLRRGIDGLARIIRFQFQLDPYDKNIILILRQTYRSDKRAYLGGRWISTSVQAD